MTLTSRGIAVATVILLGLANVAAAPTGRWLHAATEAQFRAIWPAEAAKQKLGGFAAMRCHVKSTGELFDCRTVHEAPAGAGFGPALLSLAPQFQMRPELIKTEAPDGEVVVAGDWYDFDKPASWLRKPTQNDLLVVWPKDAWRKGIGGRATISCTVSVQGALFDCIVQSENPAGQNFGAAAIALTPQFLMRPATLKDQPVVSIVTIPIVFASSGGGFPEEGRRMASPAMAWPEAPSYADVAAAYPKKAQAEHLAGRATLTCEFQPSGHLHNCRTVTEEPAGKGFGEAARTLTKLFRASTTTSDGKPLDTGGVQLPFVFDPGVLADAKPAIGKPLWAALPSAEDTQAAFAGVSMTSVGTVRVTLHCTVQSGGKVTDCEVTHEEPTGKGVGQAALTLAPHFRVTTWSMEGLPTVGGTINIPLRYEGQAQTPTPAKP